jgi:hypothetical protein
MVFTSLHNGIFGKRRRTSKFMKQLFSCILLLCSPFVARLQESKQEAKSTPQSFNEKSKLQRTGGRILLITGAALLASGIIIPQGPLIADYYTERHSYDRLKTVLISAGVTATIASVPFFIASRKNLKRSASVGFNIERCQKLAGQNLVLVSIPALGLKIVL